MLHLYSPILKCSNCLGHVKTSLLSTFANFFGIFSFDKKKRTLAGTNRTQQKIQLLRSNSSYSAYCEGKEYIKNIFIFFLLFPLLFIFLLDTSRTVAVRKKQQILRTRNFRVNTTASLLRSQKSFAM